MLARIGVKIIDHYFGNPAPASDNGINSRKACEVCHPFTVM